MNKKTNLYLRNLRLARSTFSVGKQHILLKTLEHLSVLRLDIGSGDLTLIRLGNSDQHFAAKIGASV